jgi:hypothetical protein
MTQTMTQAIQHIVIVGGGSAGWLTAGLLAAEHMGPNSSIKVSLIESPQVNSIGVGEGTWPSMRSTLNRIGISEAEFVSCCDASFKQGSKFINWRNDNDDDFYYHPFMIPQGYTQADLYQGWKTNQQQSFADTVSVQSLVCEAGLAPKQQGTPEYASVTNYGYHLDAVKFAQLLQRHCTSKLKVNHILDHVEAVQNDANGYISAIVCQDNGQISGDLFVDCTGLQGLLINQHYHVPFMHKSDILFNDSALAVQLPYPDANSPINSATLSTAQEAGWIWDIGLPTRRGVGYTYSSKHSNDEDASKVLKAYAANIIGEQAAQALEPRKISFNPGHREKFWHKNCVAIGMSAGFLEPLEASALALVELSSSMLSEQLPSDFEHMNIVAERFNQRFTYRWNRVIDFLKLHYVLSERQGTYWQDNKAAASIPEPLQQLLQLWSYQSPSRFDFIQNEEVFPSASYQFVLYGMGFETQTKTSSKIKDDSGLIAKVFADNQYKVTKFAQALPSNRELIEHMKKTSKQKAQA